MVRLTLGPAILSIGIFIVLFCPLPSSSRVLEICKRRNCEWLPWQPWSRCDADCGRAGRQLRLRFFRHKEACGGHPCEGDAMETKHCTRSCIQSKSLYDDDYLVMRSDGFGSGDVKGSGDIMGSGDDNQGSGGFIGSGNAEGSGEENGSGGSEGSGEIQFTTKVPKPELTTPPEVATTQPPINPPQSTCRITQAINGDFVINSDDAFWEHSSFCEIFCEDSVSTDHYKVSIDLYHDSESISGKLGLMYNVIDQGNFDFVYFRTSQYGWCYQFGYYSEGLHNVHSDWKGNCDHGAPYNRMWFKVVVHVTDNEAHVTLDGYPVSSITPHYRARGIGGVIAGKGYLTTTRYKNYAVNSEPEPSDSPHLTLHGCLAGSRDTYLAADPDSPGTYCRVVVEEVNGNTWTISADFYNEMVWQGVEPAETGVIFQFSDNNNYQFVSFRFTRQNVCAHATRVSGGIAHTSASTECIDNAPPSDTWFHVKVNVEQPGYVTTFLDNREVLKFPATNGGSSEENKAGVIMANGHIGVLRFKNFHVDIAYDEFMRDELYDLLKVMN